VATARDPLRTGRYLEARHGPAVYAPMAGIDVLHLFGPDALGLALRNDDAAFSNRLGWARYLDHVFPGAILAMDGREHRVQRRIMQAAFTRDSLRDYVERMNPNIGRGVDQWLAGQRRRDGLRVYPALKRLTLDVATSTFMGIASGRDADRINAAFVAAVTASMALVRVDAWPTSYWRGLRGRRYLVERIRELLPMRRGRQLPDLFSQMCSARSEEGERFSDDEVINHMIFVMMAAHDTSTSALTTMMYLLARYPDWQVRLREHSLALGKDTLDIDQLGALDEMTWVMQEALRLYPPLAIMPRMTVKPVAFAGYEIPPYTMVALSPIATHHTPSLWTNPDRFDPVRFSPDRAEHKRHRYAWAPFGGGAHVCIGQHFAGLEIRSTLHQLLRRYRWSIPPTYRMPFQFLPIAKPRDGLPLRIERL
jgi:cytochrome P450